MDGSETAAVQHVRRPLVQEVVEGVKQHILDNRLGPGDPLPNESSLCGALGASRSSVREAIKILHALDIVEIRRGHGTFVGRLSLSALVEGLTFRGLLRREDDVRIMSELTEVRELFERGMAERIVTSLNADHLELLYGLVDDMKAAGSVGKTAFIEADRAFHALLVEPLESELIGQLAGAFWDVNAIVAPHLTGVTAAQEAETVARHRAIVEAAHRKDAAAFAEAITAHYEPVRRRIEEARSEAAG